MIDTLASPLWMTLVVFSGFLFHWVSVLFEWKRIKPFTKALAMILVILWTLIAVHVKVDYFISLLLASQVFGLLGDILLLFPGKWFVRGLGAFMVGHLFYLGLLSALLLAGWKDELLSSFPWSVALIGLVLWVSYLIVFTRLFSPYIYKSKSDLPFWGSVVLYGAILSFIVVFSAFCISVLPEFSWAQLFLPVGAALFFISDNLLAYDRFVKKIRNGSLWVIVTYHLGQFSLAAGILYLIGLMTEISA